MNKTKLYFCLFLFILSCLYLKGLCKNISFMDFILGNKSLSSIQVLSNKKFSDPVSFLSFNDKTFSRIKEVSSIKKNVNNSSSKLVKVYIYNTHQTEEYASNVYGITPSVRTVSDILYSELKSNGISSLVEKRDIIKETKKRGYDYTGTYTVSFDYLTDSKKNNPSLEYFFDLHRDSITGEYARTKINEKDYATMMFLVGASHDDYQKNVNNVNIMKKYLDDNYPGLVRDTYIQKKCSFFQDYSPKMFLVEIGGPDNTLEEIYNTTKALSLAIKYYMEVDNG